MNNKVMIITRTNDRPLLLSRALMSVSKQSYENYLHVIITGSKANIRDVEASCRKNCKSYLIIDGSADEKGFVGNLLNMGLKIVKESNEFEYISILDDDDQWDPDFLSKMISHITETKAHGVVCNSIIIKEEIIGEKIVELSRQVYEKGVESTQERYGFPGQFLYNTSVLDKIKEYPNNLHVWCEYYFWKKFLTFFDVSVCPEYLYKRHVRKNKDSSYDNLISHVDIKFEGDNFVKNALLEGNDALVLYMQNLIQKEGIR